MQKKKIINIRAEINETEYRKSIEKINKIDYLKREIKLLSL